MSSSNNVDRFTPRLVGSAFEEKKNFGIEDRTKEREREEKNKTKKNKDDVGDD